MAHIVPKRIIIFFKSNKTVFFPAYFCYTCLCVLKVCLNCASLYRVLIPPWTNLVKMHLVSSIWILKKIWFSRKMFINKTLNLSKVLMQGKLFQRCTHFLYCSVLSLAGKVNTRRMSQPDMESIFTKNYLWNILVIGIYYVNYQNYQN